MAFTKLEAKETWSVNLAGSCEEELSLFSLEKRPHGHYVHGAPPRERRGPVGRHAVRLAAATERSCYIFTKLHSPAIF